ncbi:hypothetical protein FIBSPDRAFT_552134 [Athelia psychrophila]|uniref:Uncharacterized protein n=1 Tax=Athelia psychrophila TaxID=1759441 RepID=A0A166UWN3_9AGAM|nr:hypothetical protein FIBSPDRAFT_552134 [Fibularhizoctonia sp. CBS 109695]
MEIKHTSVSRVWDIFVLRRSASTIVQYAHSVGANAHIPRAIPAVRRREESIAYIFKMLAEQRRIREGRVSVPPSGSGEASVLSELQPAADGPQPQLRSPQAGAAQMQHEKDGPSPNSTSYGPCTPLWSRPCAQPRRRPLARLPSLHCEASRHRAPVSHAPVPFVKRVQTGVQGIFTRGEKRSKRSMRGGHLVPESSPASELYVPSQPPSRPPMQPQSSTSHPHPGSP